MEIYIFCPIFLQSFTNSCAAVLEELPCQKTRGLTDWMTNGHAKNLLPLLIAKIDKTIGNWINFENKWALQCIWKKFQKANINVNDFILIKTNIAPYYLIYPYILDIFCFSKSWLNYIFRNNVIRHDSHRKQMVEQGFTDRQKRLWTRMFLYQIQTKK